MDYTLIRSSRRTLCLSIDADGRLIARAPAHLPTAQIEDFIARKADWIAQKQADMRVRLRLELTEGAVFPYLGNKLRVRRVAARSIAVAEDALVIPLRVQGTKPVADWMRRKAAEELPLRVEQLAALTGLHPSRIAFTAAHTRWGSMNATRVMRLNVALLHCPPAVIDYVIVHELCHIRHMNHSRDFWACVERFVPQYAQHRAWLRQNSALIDFLRETEH